MAETVSIIEEVYYVSVEEETYKIRSIGVEEVYNISLAITDSVGMFQDDVDARIIELRPDADYSNPETFDVTNLVSATAAHQAIIWYNESLGHFVVSAEKTLDTLGGTGMPEYFQMIPDYLKAGVRSISADDTTWNTSKAIIKEIRVNTESTNWDMTLLGKPVDATMPYRQIMEAGYGSENIFLDLPYHDESDSNQIHLSISDNDGGTHSFYLTVLGTELA